MLGVLLLWVFATLGLWIRDSRKQDRGHAEAGRGMPFDERSLEFARGVEFGLLFGLAKDYGRAEMAVHADMAGLVRRLARSQGIPFRAAPHEHDEGCAECTGRSDCKDGGEWLDVTIGA